MPENRIKEITPYALRITASGALFAGSIINLMSNEDKKPDVFFLCSLYSSLIYMGTNLVDIVNIVKRPSYVERVENEEMGRFA